MSAWQNENNEGVMVSTVRSNQQRDRSVAPTTGARSSSVALLIGPPTGDDPVLLRLVLIVSPSISLGSKEVGFDELGPAKVYFRKFDALIRQSSA